MTDLVFPDPQGYADLATLVRRAHRADPDAAVRLQVTGRVLRVWAGVLPGVGLLADGAAVGVRGIELADEVGSGSGAGSGSGDGSGASGLDIVCASAALTDRFAEDGVGASRLSVPPASRYAAWSGALPAAAGWSAAGSIPAHALIDAARAGIADIAEGVDADHTGVAAGSRAVLELRRRVWARPVPITTGDVEAPRANDHAAANDHGGLDSGPAPTPGIPAGAAFAAYVLGFLPDPSATVRVWRNGRWVRLQTAAGHVVARP